VEPRNATTESEKRLSPGRSPPKKSGLALEVGRNTVFPQLRAGAGIERDHAIERRAVHQLVAHQNRRRFEGAVVQRLRLDREITGMEFPRALQRRDIAPVDLSDLRIARATGVAAVVSPAGCTGDDDQQLNHRVNSDCVRI
jgi:hypothetical protein